MVSNDPNRTHFLNVDLEIDSTSDLQPLVEALSGSAFTLYCGRVRRTYCARLALARQPKGADAAIRALCSGISRLDKTGRDLWKSARRRDFSIGIQAGGKPQSCDFAIQPATLKTASNLGAGIIFTVYAPDPAG